MKSSIYNALVNKHCGINNRYHKVHDGSLGWKKVWSWIYLIILNIAYYMFFMRFLDKPQNVKIYEEKNLKLSQSESSMNEITLNAKLDELIQNYDIVSFDIFDTLIFRPFSEPADLFYFIGNELKYMDFKKLRMQMEHKARLKKYRSESTYEVTLNEIWEYIEGETGINKDNGITLEEKYELMFCYANPYMKSIYQRLIEAGKRIVIVSDMYLPKEFLKKVLNNNGYTGYEELYISCEYGMSKGNGKLFQEVKKEKGESLRYAHIGDNLNSDVKMAKQNGFVAYHYPNVNRNAILYRAYDMSPIIGGAYRGIVDNHIYCGDYQYSMNYEYGFIYGGVFITGYCNYIHKLYELKQIDKVLFLARDGDIIKKAYNKLFPNDKTEYVYWSRLAATKLTANYYQYDYFRRFLNHKVNQNYTLDKIFNAMELDFLVEELPKGICSSDELTDRNLEKIKSFLKKNWNKIIERYAEQQEAAKKWYSDIISDCKKIAIVDIGWAGSGAIALDCLINNEWKINCECIGIVAGTNTVYNFEPDATETFFQTGKLYSYLFSFASNRDLLKLHDPNKGYNIFWELLTSSPQPSFKGFYLDGKGNVELQFQEPEKNSEGIQEIQEGIVDFVDQYREHFGKQLFMFDISGRDAYAPMVIAASHREAYLNVIKQQFDLIIGVGN